MLPLHARLKRNGAAQSAPKDVDALMLLAIICSRVDRVAPRTVPKPVQFSTWNINIIMSPRAHTDPERTLAL
jgi:hypothetical protein